MGFADDVLQVSIFLKQVISDFWISSRQYFCSKHGLSLWALGEVKKCVAKSNGGTVVGSCEDVLHLEAESRAVLGCLCHLVD